MSTVVSVAKLLDQWNRETKGSNPEQAARFDRQLELIFHIKEVEWLLHEGEADRVCHCGTIPEAFDAGLRMYSQLREHQCQHWVAQIIFALTLAHSLETINEVSPATAEGMVVDLTKDVLDPEQELVGRLAGGMAKLEQESVDDAMRAFMYRPENVPHMRDWVNRALEAEHKYHGA